MTRAALDNLLRHLRRLANLPAVAATDGNLLQRYAASGDEAAFETLLRRHASLVWSVCRRLLGDEHDAEDAFQAAFLVLLRKAGSLRVQQSLAPWLHTVAYRVALKAKVAAGRRRLREARAEISPSSDPLAIVEVRDLRSVLDAELNRLPEKYRAPLVLCYLEGLTYTEAARRLGWRGGTVCGRLARGREMLRKRLSRRGLTLSGAALLAALAEPAAAPAASVAAVLRTAALFALGQSAGIVSVPVATLACGVLRAMTVAKLKMAGTLLAALCVCAAGVGLAAQHFLATKPTEEQAPVNAPPEKPKNEQAKHTDLYGDPLPVGAVARLGTVRFRHADYLHKIAFTADGKTVVSAGGDGVRVWEAATGRPLRHFGTGVLPWSISLSPDGRCIALSRHHAGAGGPVELWDVASGKLLHRVGNRHYSLVRFSPDGKLLAALAGEHTPGAADIAWDIDIWDAETGQDIRTLTGPREYISDMAFSADGKTLLLGGSGKAISLRNVADGKEVRRLRDLPADVHSLALSPRGDRVAFIEFWLKKHAPGHISYDGGTHVFLVDLRTGAEMRRWKMPPEINSNEMLRNGWWNVVFSTDGRKLAACEKDGPIRVWDTETGKETRLLPDGRTHSGGMAFSPDGKTLAVGDSGRVIRLFDADSGAERVTTEGHRGGVTALAAAIDGHSVITATEEGMIHRWDARTGRELGRLPGHKGEVTSLALSADGRQLYSVGHDETLRVWDVNSGKDRRLRTDKTVFWARITLSVDGRTLAVPVNYKELHLFNLATGERLQRLTTKTQILAVAFAADAPVVMALTGDRTIWRWQTTTGRRLPDLSLPLDRDEPPIDNPDSSYGGERIVFSPGGRLVGHAIEDRFLRVLDVSAQREVYRMAKLPGKVSALAFAADGRTLAWAEESGVVHWLELASWSERRRLPGHAGAVRQMVFSADGRLLISGSDDATGLVWDLLGRGSATLTAKELAACWDDIAGKDAARAHRAMRRLIAAPADALAFLRPRLKAVEKVDEKRIERWIADLDSDAFAVRETAARELRKLGELAEPALRKTLAARPTLETRRRLRALLEDVSQEQWHPAPEILRQLRAVEVLEGVGTTEARKLLELLSGGAAGARQTRDAKAALVRLAADPPSSPRP